MIINETKLKGAFIIDINRIEDERGFFTRTYCKKELEAQGINAVVVQSNLSYNKVKGTLRGMHMQVSPFHETKFVRCTKGAIYDVIVDLRSYSRTYKQWIGVELSAENYRMLCVPEGFCHGFITLEDDTEVSYQVTGYYTPGAEVSYMWNDPTFDIKWPLEPVVISAKDKMNLIFEPQLSV